MSVTRYLTDRSWPGEIFLLYSCHSPRDFIFKEELETLQHHHPNLHVIATVSNAEGSDWKGPTGRITKELIEQSVPDIIARRVHICGPKKMMEATEKFLAELGVPKEQVKTEAFGPATGHPEPEPKPTDNTAQKPNDSIAAAPPASAPAAQATTPDAAPTETPSEPPPAADPAVATTVTFSRSTKTAPLPPEKSVLEASEDIGVNIPFECRVGTCGVCKTKLVSGQVTMAVEDALTPEDKAAGIILACQAKSTGNLTVEA
jgi:ferredoxin-NADP reductase